VLIVIFGCGADFKSKLRRIEWRWTGTTCEQKLLGCRSRLRRFAQITCYRKCRRRLNLKCFCIEATQWALYLSENIPHDIAQTSTPAMNIVDENGTRNSQPQTKLNYTHNDNVKRLN